jgi:O-antigen ligase
MSMNPAPRHFTAQLPGSATLAWWVAGVGASLVLAFGVVRWPYLVSGLAFGVLIAAVAIFQPLALVGFMLAIGPVDLAFLTGGFKALFPGLGGLDMNGIRLVGITGGFVAVTLASHQVQQALIGPRARWYLLFLVWGLASLVISLDMNEGSRLLLKLAYPLLTFVIVSALVENQKQLDRLMLWTLGVGALLLVVVNPLFVLGGAYTIDWQGFLRARGVGAGENAISFYLLVILLISFTRFLVRNQWRYLALCGVAGFWIMLTRTRITILGMFFAMLVMTIYATWSARNYRAVVFAGLFGVVMGSMVLPGVLERSLGQVPTPGQLYALARSPRTMYETVNWQGRQVLWPVIYNEFRTRPLTGLGLGSSSAVIRENFPYAEIKVAHNEYLRLITDTGLIGGLLYFTAIMSWIVAVIGASWRHRDARVREFAIPALGAITAWVFIAFTDNAFDYYGYFTQYVGFLCAGTFVAVRLARGSAGPEMVSNV